MEFQTILQFVAYVGAGMAEIAAKIAQVAEAAYWITSTNEDAVQWRQAQLEADGYSDTELVSGRSVKSTASPKIFLGTYAAKIVSLMGQKPLVTVEAMQRWASLQRQEAKKLTGRERQEWRACESWVMQLRRWACAFDAVRNGVDLSQIALDWNPGMAERIKGLNTFDLVNREINEKSRATPQKSREQREKLRKESLAEARKAAKREANAVDGIGKMLDGIVGSLEGFDGPQRVSVISLLESALKLARNRHDRLEAAA